MTDSYDLDVPLSAGHIDHWLAAGPYPLPLTPALGEATPEALRQAMYEAAPGVVERPAQLAQVNQGDTSLEWRLVQAYGDHVIHLSQVCTDRRYLRAWAYVELVSARDLTVRASLTLSGPADVWCRDTHCHRYDAFAGTVPGQTSVDLDLGIGVNPFLVRLEQVGSGPTPVLLACRLHNSDGITVRIPIATERVDQVAAYGALFQAVSPAQDEYYAKDNVAVRWAQALPAQAADNRLPILLRLQNPQSKIYAETMAKAAPDSVTGTLLGQELVTGPYQLVLLPPRELVAEGRVRVRRTFDIAVLSGEVVANDQRPYAARLYDGVHLVMRQDRGLATDRALLAEWAAMTLGAWQFVHTEALQQATLSLTRSSVNLDLSLLALIGIDAGYRDDEAYPAVVSRGVDTCLARLVGSSPPPQCEVDTLLHHTVMLLAAQRLPDERFLAVQQRGLAIRETTEATLREWLFRKGRHGLLTLADDGEALDHLILGLSQLADMADDTLVRELAAVLLDKTLFLMALNSFRGIGPGGTTGTTAGVGRAVWGSGVYNTHLWSIVGLANARNYPVPTIVAEVAGDLAQRTAPPTLIEEHHSDGTSQKGATAPLLTRRTYRTPDYALTSIVTPEGTLSQRTWVARLSAETAIWTHQPVHYGTYARERASFWEVDAALPQIDHWESTLIAHYRQPAHDLLGFTHAHFPTEDLSAAVLKEGWAFAQQGNTYVAITASAPIELMTTGPGARRELRAHGPTTSWLCQLGRAAEHGTFAAFRDRVLSAPLALDAGAVVWTSLGGSTLESRWHQPLVVDGVAQNLAPRRHLESPYCTVDFPATQMDITIGDLILRLDFSE